MKVCSRTVFFFLAAISWLPVMHVSAETKTISVPEDTKVVSVESSYCEPIYNESTGTLYVPRCWHLAQEEEPGYVERTVDRSTEQLKTEVENSINNGIDRQIMKVGRKIDEITGVR